MSLKLSDFSEDTDYHLHFNDPVWWQVAETICDRHGLIHQAIRRSPQGENIIFLVDDSLIIKIFAPFRDNYQREKAALDYVQGKLSIRTPDLLHTGEFESWPYLVMTQLTGFASREVWTSLPRRDRFEIISRLGVAIRELHGHDAPLQTPLDRNWEAFLNRQVSDAVERQRACGANNQWLECLPSYIEARFALLPPVDKPVFLHGDIHAGNLLLKQAHGCWRITGLCDFGDSLCGFHEYEFVAPGILMVQGDGELQRAMLLAYGYSEHRLDLTFRARLMLLTILYECSDLRKYALRLTPDAINFTLDELERAIWKFTDE